MKKVFYVLLALAVIIAILFFIYTKNKSIGPINTLEDAKARFSALHYNVEKYEVFKSNGAAINDYSDLHLKNTGEIWAIQGESFSNGECFGSKLAFLDPLTGKFLGEGNVIQGCR